jgi:hypothetical protein
MTLISLDFNKENFLQLVFINLGICFFRNLVWINSGFIL